MLCTGAGWAARCSSHWLARLPNLTIIKLVCLHEASNALWDQRGAIKPFVQRLEVEHLLLAMSDLLLPFPSILCLCPALSTSPCTAVVKQMASRLELHAHIWHACKTCVKLVTLTID